MTTYADWLLADEAAARRRRHADAILADLVRERDAEARECEAFAATLRESQGSRVVWSVRAWERAAAARACMLREDAEGAAQAALSAGYALARARVG